MDNVTIIEGASDTEIAGWMAENLAQRIGASEGPAEISVPGGSTPFPIFVELAGHDLDFARLSICAGDDRLVAEDHSASNTGKIREAFAGTEAQVIVLADMEQDPGRYALCWLGMGGDGHIASLFPNTDPQVDDPELVRRITPDPLPPEAPFDRVTLTIPALLNTDQLMFVIRGADKRAVLDAAIAGEHDLPIARLLRAAQERAVPVTIFT